MLTDDNGMENAMDFSVSATAGGGGAAGATASALQGQQTGIVFPSPHPARFRLYNLLEHEKTQSQHKCNGVQR